jgi:membrane-associated protein
MLMIGYEFGASMAPVIDKYLIPAMALIVLLSISPILLELVRERRKKRAGGADGVVEAAAAPVPAQRPSEDEATAGGRHRRR